MFGAVVAKCFHWHLSQHELLSGAVAWLGILNYTQEKSHFNGHTIKMFVTALFSQEHTVLGSDHCSIVSHVTSFPLLLRIESFLIHVSRLQFPSLFSSQFLSTSPPLQIHFPSVCLRENGKICMTQHEAETIVMKLDTANQQKEKSPENRHRNQRPTHSYTQESHKNTEL